MVLAGSALGYEVQLSLFPPPDPANGPAPVARLTLLPLLEVMPEGLFSTLMIRHTHAGSYKSGSVGEIHLDRLRALAPYSNGEKIHIANEDSKRRELTQFLHDLSHEGSQKAAMVKEGSRWITSPPRAEEGLPIESLGLPISVRVRFAFLRFLAFQRELREVARQALLRQGHGIEAPAYLLMTTQNPGPAGYLHAGRWMENILLTLNQMELGVQALHLPISLAFCHPELRRIFGAGEEEEPLLLLRFGQPEQKAWPRTHRRKIMESLIRP
jgi:hypothetical protein